MCYNGLTVQQAKGTRYIKILTENGQRIAMLDETDTFLNEQDTLDLIGTLSSEHQADPRILPAASLSPAGRRGL